MSLCYYIQDRDQVFVGADTAVTIDGKRSVHELPKLMLLNGGSLLFMAGTVNCNVAISRHLASIPKVTPKDVQQAIRLQYVIELKTHGDYDKEKGKDLLSAIFFEMSSEGIAKSYQMRSIDNFEILEARAPKQGLYAAAGGYDAEKAQAKGLGLMKGAFNPVEVIRNVFEHVSGRQVGGSLIIYKLSASGIQFLTKEPIKEKLRFSITHAPLYDPYAHMEAGTVIGSVIAGSEMNGNIIRGGSIYGTNISTRETGYPRITMTETNDLLTAEYSANRKITIDPNNYLTNQYPHLRWESDGYEAHIHNAGEAGLQIEADTVVVKADLDVQSGGKFWAPSLSHYTFGSNPRSLQSELNDYVLQLEYDMKIASLEARIRALEDA